MFGHKWEQAQATVIGVQDAPPTGHASSSHLEHQYLVEVRLPSGDVLRGSVTQRSLIPHPAGSPIPVQVNAKSGEIRIDPAAKAESMRDLIGEARQLRAQMGQAAGTGAAPIPGGAAGLAALAAGTATGSVHIIGAAGPDLTAAGVSASEVTGLAQAMMSGDAAARQAAVERLKQIKEQATHQAGTGPSTFDPVSPPVSGPPPDTFGSFDLGPGEGSTEQKLARLRQLLDKGILTDSEYQAQAQQLTGRPAPPAF